MERNFGGRPPHHDGETKRSAIAVRTAPSIREALKRSADEAGRSITQEVEARLIVSFDRDAGQRSTQTEQLLNRIAAEISEIEQWTGKRWHRDRRTAGAVMEMLEGARRWVATDDPADDELVKSAWERMEQVRHGRKKLIEYLRSLGLNPAAEPLVLTVATMQDPLDRRWAEKHQIAHLDLPDEIKVAATLVIEQLEKIDIEVKAASDEYDELVKPYTDAESEGRELYRKSRRRQSFDALARLRAHVASIGEELL